MEPVKGTDGAEITIGARRTRFRHDPALVSSPGKTHAGVMQAFASTLLVGLMRSELAAQGLIGAGEAPVPGRATTPLGPKRDLLEVVAAGHGLLPLLRVGEGVARLPVDPVLGALLAAREPADAVARWQRLDRFLHSCHRVIIVEAGPRRLVLRHAGPPGEAPPTPGEDALILGALATLARLSGATGLSAAFVTEGREAPVLGPKGWSEPPRLSDTGLWVLAWEAPPVPRPVPTGTNLAAHARGLIAADLGRAWSPRDLADALGVSPRTLQRRLRAASTSLRDMMAAARVEAAAAMLSGTARSLGAVGFACGFADQPHLTRTFRRRTGLTPAAWRQAFGT
jgi:AraC-like DNA-binding protein